MVLMVEKGIRGGICPTIYRYTKAYNKYMNYFDKNKESPYLQNWNVNSLYVWAMSEKFQVSNFEWINDTSQFHEDFIKNYNEKVMKDIFLKLMFNVLKI